MRKHADKRKGNWWWVYWKLVETGGEYIKNEWSEDQNELQIDTNPLNDVAEVYSQNSIDIG